MSNRPSPTGTHQHDALMDGLAQVVADLEAAQPAPESPLLTAVRDVSHRRTALGTAGPFETTTFAHGYQAALADIVAAMAAAGPADARRAAATWALDNAHDNAVSTLAALIQSEPSA